MKKFKFNLIATLSIILLLSGCSSDDKIIDQVTADTTRGAILRTLESSGQFNYFEPETSIYSVTFEEQDHQNGDLLESVDIYLSFTDRTPDNGSDNSTDEVFSRNIPASDFTLSSNGLPTSSFEYSLTELESALGLTDSDYTGGDNFNIRLELNLTDGRSFTNTDASGNIASGSFFQSPYLYAVTVKCIPLISSAGEYTINMYDSYGDGWQTTDGSGGDPMTVTVNGDTVIEFGMCNSYVPTDYDCTPGTTSATTTITIPEDPTSTVWHFPGDFYGEITVEIYNPDGSLAAEIGPNTAAGEFQISQCPVIE